MALVARIDLNALKSNWLSLAKQSSPARAAAVVKANGYGLGASEIAGALAEAGARRFYVAWPHEGAQLRTSLGAEPEIAVFHGPSKSSLALFAEANLQPVINSVEQLGLWRSFAPDMPYALQIDTGMNRLGIASTRWAEVSETATPPNYILSHLACADEPGHPLNDLQRSRFEEAALLWPSAKRSLSATAGIYLGAKYRFDEVRPGIGVFGGGPAAHGAPELKTVLRLLASIVQVRDIAAGQAIGYGASWISASPTRVAIVGVGYADGFLRSASGRGLVSIGGNLCPVVGRVSMDLIAVDVADLRVSEGDKVELLGEAVSLTEQSKRMSTIDYELLTRLGPRAVRIYSR